MSLVTELERLADALGDTSDEAPPVAWTSVAERIARNLNVKPEEVGILGLSQKWRHLYFLFPEALRNVGFIPLTSNSALAARTVRESRPEINNSFAASRHATVFEGVKTSGVDAGEAIQKIISAPILSGEKVIGVIQISRKGPNAGAPAPILPQPILEKFSRSANRSENCCNTSPKISSFILHSYFLMRSFPCVAPSRPHFGLKCVDSAKPSCYFSTAADFFLSPTYGGTHTDPWRSSRRKFFSPKASENTGKDFRALSWLSEMRESLRATSFAFLRSSLQTAN